MQPTGAMDGMSTGHGLHTQEVNDMAPADGDPGHDQIQCDAGHLTRRQVEVLRAIAQDLSARLIAGNSRSARTPSTLTSRP